MFKLWNIIGNRMYKAINLSGGAELFNMRLCLQSREDVSLPCQCKTACFPCLPETARLSLVWQFKASWYNSAIEI